VKDHRISSVNEALSLVADVRPLRSLWYSPRMTEFGFTYPFGLWFRGQSDAAWSLEPSAFRRAVPTGSALYDETSMFYHFRLLRPDLSQSHQSTFDWLCVMQHFGLPTRLLDWSESVLVALFFAVADPTGEYAQDGRLYVLNAVRLNECCDFGIKPRNGLHVPRCLNVIVRSGLAASRAVVELRKESEIERMEQGDGVDCELLLDQLERDHTDCIERLRSPVAVFPFRSNTRMIAQSGMFTLHGGKVMKTKPSSKKTNLDPISLEDINARQTSRRKFLASYRIPKRFRRKIQEQLHMIGIHEATLFPELHNQAAYVKAQWRYK
jgi:FRG domain-containing protein